MKVVIMRAMRGEFPSMDVYADGLARGLRTAFPDWEIVEMEPTLRFNHTISSKWERAKNGVLRYWDRFWKYPRAVAAVGADVVHVMSDHHFQVARWTRGMKTKCVATCHDLIYYRKRDNIEQFAKFVGISRWAQEYGMKSLRFCDRVITLSQDNVTDLQKFLGIEPGKITVIHNAVAEHFRPPQSGEREAARKKLGLTDEFAMVHVGTVEPRKNVDSILKVLIEVKNENVLFIKVGNDFTEIQKAYVAENQLAPRIRFLGRIPNPDVLSIYHACDALIFPSLYEGFPFPICEALSSDLPVITSTASSLPETAGGAALLVDPFDIAGFATAIRRLRDEPGLRAEQIEKGRKRVAQLTWVENARAVAEVYRR